MLFFHLGRYVLLIRASLRKPEKFSFYWQEIAKEMVSIGIGSLGLICIISLFMGAVTAVQAAYQLVFVSSLISSSVIGSITRDNSMLELSPTIGGLILSGKIGSNIASQIGTMRVSEQIDALDVMGINSPGYLILPKLIAGMTMIPFLVIFSVVLTIFGGLVAGHFSDAVSYRDYITGLQSDMPTLIPVVGLAKAFVYAFIIISTSAYQGFYVNGGAIEVGRASTRAVVVSCILILIADYLIAQLLL